MRMFLRILIFVVLVLIVLLVTGGAFAHDRVYVGSYHRSHHPVPMGMPYVHHHGPHYHVAISRAAPHLHPPVHGYAYPVPGCWAIPKVTVIVIGR